MFLSLLSNAALAKRFLQLVALVPLILRFMERAESTRKAGADKRAQVMFAVHLTLQELSKLGYMPDEMLDREEITKTAGSLTDALVAIYNAAGFFKHK
jgi:hypothetical protein